MEPLDDETPAAYAALLEYCELGPGRSLEKLSAARIASNSKGSHQMTTLKAWSSKHQWQTRAKTYDQQQAKLRSDAKLQLELEAREKMDERHALIGTTQQTRALNLLKELSDAKDIDARTAVTLLKLAIDVERNARGATQKVEHIGKDGGPIEHEHTGSVAVYLPKKDDVK